MRVTLIAGLLLALVAAAPAGAAPANDDVDDAVRLGALPARVSGATDDATTERDEPASRCGRTSGSVWYRLRADRRGPIAVTLEAEGTLQAVVGVFRRTRTSFQPVA